MSHDDDEQRTLPATQRRRRLARERGDISRSPDLTAAMILLAASGLLWICGPSWGAFLLRSIQLSLISESSTISSSDIGTKVSDQLVRMGWQILLPVCACTLLISITANFVQAGWILRPLSLTVPGLMPAANLTDRLFGEMRKIVRLFAVGLICCLFVTARWNWIAGLRMADGATILVVSVRLIAELCLWLSISLVGLGIADLGWRIYCREKRLMMTPQEQRREQQEEETDPRIRQRQRSELQRRVPSI